MTNEEATNVLRIMASGIELKGYTEIWISSFKEAYEMAIKALEDRPTGECCGSCYLCDVGDCKADLQKGGERYAITDEDIERLKNGEILNFFVNDEYSCTLEYVADMRGDNNG